MHWFKDVAWNDLALAAVASISPLGVWVPFWFDHRQKSRDRHQRQLGELERLRVHLREHIEPWANEWPENSYNHDWYLPSWQARAFEWRHVEEFNRLVMAGDYPRELTAGLVRLEGAARRFHAALAKQNEFRSKLPDVVKNNLQPVYAAAQARTAALSGNEIGSLSPGLGEEGRRWVEDLYEGNRRIHVESIGRQGRAGGLYDCFQAVVGEIDKVQRALQTPRDPWWYLWGHAFAGILALTGLLFLGDFWWSFVDDRLYPRATVALASPDGTSKAAAPLDTSHAAARAAKSGSPSPAPTRR